MADSVVMDVVRAVSDAKGIDPADLDYSLQTHVPLDAIERLASHDGASWTLSFDLPDHEVTITSDGVILVDGVREEHWAAP